MGVSVGVPQYSTLRPYIGISMIQFVISECALDEEVYEHSEIFPVYTTAYDFKYIMHARVNYLVTK